MTLDSEYKLREFKIVFEYTSPEEVEDIPLWTEVDDVADVSDAEFAKNGPFQNKPTAVKQTHDQSSPIIVKQSTPARPKRPNGSVRFDLEPKPPTNKPSPATPSTYKASTSPITTRLSSPKQEQSSSSTSAIPDTDKIKANIFAPGWLDYKERKSGIEMRMNVDEMVLNRSLLDDLLPSDIDTMLDIGSDKIYVRTLDGEDSDSVSCVSSVDMGETDT